MKNPPTPLNKLTNEQLQAIVDLTESRILHISKDDLRMSENVLLWSGALEMEIVGYWEQLNKAWEVYNKTGILPPCTCADHENGFLAKEKWNPYFKYGEPCSLQYFKKWKLQEAQNGGN